MQPGDQKAVRPFAKALLQEILLQETSQRAQGQLAQPGTVASIQIALSHERSVALVLRHHDGEGWKRMLDNRVFEIPDAARAIKSFVHQVAAITKLAAIEDLRLT